MNARPDHTTTCLTQLSTGRGRQFINQTNIHMTNVVHQTLGMVRWNHDQ